MPLFGHKEPAPEPAPPVQEKHGLFHSKRNSVDTNSTTTNTSDSSRLNRNSTKAGLFHRSNEDPSIMQARQRVQSAETAEREADRALVQARTAVREAHEHVRHLEREAEEDARLAKIKQGQARDISKKAKVLGRKFFPGL